jgi:hypothetical protein
VDNNILVVEHGNTLVSTATLGNPIKFRQVIAKFKIGMFNYTVYKSGDYYAIEHYESNKLITNHVEDWEEWKEDRENYVRLISESPTFEIGEIVFGKNETVTLDIKSGGQGINSQDRSEFDLRSKHGL